MYPKNKLLNTFKKKTPLGYYVSLYSLSLILAFVAIYYMSYGFGRLIYDASH